jgi:hypothetical protein
VLQHTGAGIFDSKWIPAGQADGEAECSPEEDMGGIQALSLPDSSTPLLPGSADYGIPAKLMENYTGYTALSGGIIPSSRSADVSREELAVRCMQAIGARMYEAAAVGAGALVAAYGCRQACSAVCWLLQLQRSVYITYL